MGMVKDNKIYLNSLASRHFMKECPPGQRCKKRGQSHQSWRHSESESEDCKAAEVGTHSGELTDEVIANTGMLIPGSTQLS